MVSLGLGPRITIKLNTGYRFKRAVDCDLTELESVLDCYAPYNERKGNWIHNPKAPDSREAYKICYETLLEINQNTELTTAKYIRKALKNKEKDSSEIFEITRTLAKYLLKNEREEGK